MKNIIYIVFALLFIACNNDDDSTANEEQEDELQFIFDINKSFILNEKWFIYQINSNEAFDLNDDGVFNTDLVLEIDECHKDNHYIFDLNQEDIAVIRDDEIECENLTSTTVYEFSGDNDNNDRTIQFRVNLLGGIFTTGSYLGVEGAISPDSSFKVIKGDSRANINGESVLLEYKLIAYSNDRP